MGSVSLNIGDGTARFRRASLCSTLLHLLMLSSLLATNLFALYAFKSTTPPPQTSTSSNVSSILSQHISSILREISLSEQKLHRLQRSLSGLSPLDPLSPSLPAELRLFLHRHPLPLGRDSRSAITHMVSSIAHSCSKSPPNLLAQFSSYKPYLPCPLADSHLPHSLLLSGCEPLPRRRCLTKPQPNPTPTKSSSMNTRPWLNPKSKNHFLIHDVLALAGPVGAVKIGLDFGTAANGDFAAATASMNVTIMTASHLSEDIDGVLSKPGVFPLMMSGAMRFPFYDGVFDLVHTVQGIDEGGVEGMGKGKAEAMEFLMFDVDRVLRAGGVFWLDSYLCVDEERKRAVTRLIERFGYKKLKWLVGEKGKGQVYLSAVLQKPARGS